MNPARIQQILQQGLAHHQAGRLKEAESFYRQARAVTTRSYELLNLSGILAYQQGRYGDAVDLLRSALSLAPKQNANACRLQLATALLAAARVPDAIVQLRAIIQADPSNAEAWNSLALGLRALGQIGEAIAAYEKAIQIKPDYFDAIDRLGALVAATQGLQAGIAHFRRAIEIKPGYAPAWTHLGITLSADGKLTEALDAFNRALVLDPVLAQARVGHALTLQIACRIEEAAAEFATALAQQPTNHEARSGRLLTLNYLSGKTRQEIFDEHLAFDRAAKSTPNQPVPAAPARAADPHRRLRVAFLSQDFRRHSVAYFIEPLLRNLDRSRFEIVLYHDHAQVDAVSDRLRGMADLWRNFAGLFHDNVEQIIRSDAPDILIDLAGHTGQNRLPLFARRLAPVQISYLGYPNTTGLKEMDYRFVDAITDPGPDDDRFHTEKLIRFAPCAWAYDPPEDAPEPTAMPMTRGITFGSFNNFAKISDATLALWQQVLTAVPESRLRLKGPMLNDPAVNLVVEQRLKMLGISRDRIELLDRSPTVADHLRQYSSIDIALDTHPYNGTTTTCEALWMGVPVITLAGDRHASRVTASLLTAAGHPELIAHSEDEYVRLATELASDITRRNNLRQTLRDDLRRSPLLDHAGQAALFASALLKCAQPHQA